MTKPAADSTTTDEASVRRARRLFFARLVEMTTKLAVAFLLPALVGIYADKKYDSRYLWTIVGIILGVAFGAYVMASVIRKVDREAGL
jgi:F0F1-type ATP synthase assembly protein I